MSGFGNPDGLGGGQMSGERTTPIAVPGPNPGLAPTIVLGGPLGFTAGAAAGTLVATIDHVPAGSVPTLTPADGRLVIAGSEAVGWFVVVGSTAASVGTIALTVTASGANGASASIGVAVSGTAPTVLPTLLKSAAGVSRVRAGGSRSVIPIIGTSIEAGWGNGVATGPGNDAGGAGWSRVNSWSHKLAASLIAAGIPARADAFFSSAQDGTTVSQITAANGGNITFGAGWSVANGTVSLGGNFVVCDGNSNGALVFTPEFSTNRFDINITGANGLGQFTVSDASGVLATVDESITNQGVQFAGVAFRTVSVTRPASSTSPITIRRISGGQVYINSIIPYDTISPRVELLNMGWPGSKTSDWIKAGSAPWDPLLALGVFSGYIDGAIVALGVNDANAGVSAATFQSNLQTIADKLSPYGDVWMEKDAKALDPNSSYNMPASYLTAVDAVQASKNSATPLNFNSLSLVTADYCDIVHLSGQGSGKEAGAAFSAFKTAIGIA